MNFIDNFLNKITMYRLVLYTLIILLVQAAILSLLGVLPYSPQALVFSAVFITVVCWLANWIFAKVFEVIPNVESVYITALILALIVSPGLGFADISFFFWVSILAMGSKYILAINKKHLFNPAAVAVVLTGLLAAQPASWWVGTSSMLPAVIIGGFLIVRKIRRFDLFLSFILTTLIVTIGFGITRGSDPLALLQAMLINSALVFFATIMLTEPMTTPPSRILQVLYGVIVGLLYVPQFHIGSFSSTPELALLAGNLFTYAVGPKHRWVLTLENTNRIGTDIIDFVFRSNRPLKFQPGQYLEWTLNVPQPDDRGNRRYFTIASSPTEDLVHLGVKFYPSPSRFKKVLYGLNLGDAIMTTQLSGSFTLPTKASEKLVFIAGGIGVTPFRSMVKYLVDKQEKRDIVLMYSNKFATEIAYADTFRAAEPLGVRTVYTLAGGDTPPADWKGRTGFIDAKMVMEEVPDYKERVFYVSGPHAMVAIFEDQLQKIGVPRHRIKVDYFPGYA